MASSGGTTGLSADAVLALRRAIYAKDSVTRDDLAALVARGGEAGNSPEFAELAGEVASDLLVHQVQPPLYIPAADADWLIATLAQAGGLTCRAEFAMLRDVISHAVSVPPALTAFAVREIRQTILAGRRDAAGGTDHAAGIVTREDVETLRVAVFAATQGSSLHVTRESAEALFAIAHATAKAENDRGFADFFAKAVGNYLIGIAFAGTPDREEVRRDEAWFAAPPVSRRDFTKEMVEMPATNFAEMRRDIAAPGKLEEAAFARENEAAARDMAKAEHIGDGPADWVAAHLSRAGELSAAEKKLLAFVREEVADMPASLRALVATAA